MQNMPIGIFRGDDTDAFSYQTIVGTINTDLDLTGCKAVFRYLGFSMEFDPIPDDRKLTIVIPADETKKFPPGLGYASLRVYDSEGRLKTFSNRIMVFVATKTPIFGSDEFEVDFNVKASLEPLKFFVGPNPDDFDEYRGYVEKVIDRASAAKYGLAILLDAIDSDLGAEDGVAATPVAVKAAYAAIIEKLTDDYYTSEQTEEAIDRVAAYYITYDAEGNPFPTYAALANAQTVYSGGKVRTPTRNDYCVVLADETHGGAEYRYIYAVADGETTGSWQPQFPVEGVMTVDQTVTKNSQNPVSGGGVWKALWGALASLPSGFSSLYDWCVSQLAGKASTADATLTERGFSEWNIVLSGDFYPDDRVTLNFGTISQAGEEIHCWGYSINGGPYEYTPIYTNPNATSLTWDNIFVHTGAGTITATRTALPGYQLGSQDDKPLASEAEAEALRTGKQNTLTAQQLANIAAVANELAFDSTRTYKPGDCVYYNGVLYVFQLPHSGVWNDNHATPLNILDIYKAWNNGASLTVDGMPSAEEASIVRLSSVLSIVFATFYKFGILQAGQGIWEGNLYFEHTDFGGKVLFPNIEENRFIALTAGPNHTGNLAALDANGNPTDSQIPAANVALKSAIPYDLGTSIVIDTASSEEVEGETVYYGAATLADRTANIVQVTAATALDELRITFPAATSGKVRDFGLRVEIGTGSAALAAPALVPIAPTGETIKIENADSAIPALADGTTTAKGVTLLYFSETAPGVFVVKGEQVEEVA